MNSLDPRVTRLPDLPLNIVERKTPLDQFGTFEVFVQPREGKSFQHEGIVHAPNLEMAYVLAKEGFTRRFLCVSLSVVATHHVFVSPTSDDNHSIFDLLEVKQEQAGEKLSYEIYVLLKRGKQHIHSGQVFATSPEQAIMAAKEMWTGRGVCNVWAILTSDFRFTGNEEKELWLTLPDKKFRDASDYKGGDKLKGFLEKNKSVQV